MIYKHYNKAKRVTTITTEIVAYTGMLYMSDRVCGRDFRERERERL